MLSMDLALPLSPALCKSNLKDTDLRILILHEAFRLHLCTNEDIHEPHELFTHPRIKHHDPRTGTPSVIMKHHNFLAHQPTTFAQSNPAQLVLPRTP